MIGIFLYLAVGVLCAAIVGRFHWDSEGPGGTLFLIIIGWPLLVALLVLSAIGDFFHWAALKLGFRHVESTDYW